MKQLGELQSKRAELEEIGYGLVAIAPNEVELLGRSVDKAGLEFPVLSDADGRTARAFGLAFRLDAETRKQYEGFGIDLAEWSGHDHGELPVPAVFVCDAEGRIQFQHVDPDYTKRIPLEVLLAMARAGAEGA